MFLVEGLKEVELAALGCGVQFGIPQPGNHLFRVKIGVIDVGSLVLLRKEGTVPENGKADWSTWAQDNITGQIGIFCSETITHPGSHAGDFGSHGAVVHEQECRAVIRVGSVDGLEQAKVVGELSRPGEQFTDVETTFAVLLVSVGCIEETAGGTFRLQVSAFGAFAFKLLQGWFGIEEVRTKGASVHEEVNDSFGSGYEVGCQA